MRMKLIGTIGFVLLTCFTMYAQGIQDIDATGQKGKFYVYWGWNRAWFTTSDLNMKGVDYDFKLHNVVASDRPSSFNFNAYFNPGKVSTPQFNFRLGYFINDHYSLSFGMDHMKYVLVQNQTVKISGRIDHGETKYNGLYDQDDIVIAADLLSYEHTDGLNYPNIEIRRHDKLFNSKSFSLSTIEGFGLGALLPRTDSKFLQNERHNKYHLAGYGLSGVIGLQLGFLKHFFIQSELKGGFINLPDVRTTNSKSDKASQHFLFAQWNYTLGANFNLSKRYKRKAK